jgi:hypothetical protein
MKINLKMKKATYLKFLLICPKIVDPRGDYQIFFRQILKFDLVFVFVVFIVSFDPIYLP